MNGEKFLLLWDNYVLEQKEFAQPLLALYAKNENDEVKEWVNTKYDMNKLRGSEKEIVIYGDEKGDVAACFDFRSMTKLTAILSILRTIYVCIIFIIGSLFFSKDAKQLVIIPIMNMIQKVNKIA